MKVRTEIDNNFGYEKITQLVDNIPLSAIERSYSSFAPLTKYFDLHFASSYLSMFL